MAIKLKITNGNYSAEGTSATIKCNGKKLAEDLTIEAVEVSDKCVFYINYMNRGTPEFEFTEGQTWYEYCKGQTYPTVENPFYCANANNPVMYAGDETGEYIGSGQTIYDSGMTTIRGNMLIEKGGAYVIRNSGGSGN